MLSCRYDGDPRGNPEGKTSYRRTSGSTEITHSPLTSKLGKQHYVLFNYYNSRICCTLAVTMVSGHNSGMASGSCRVEESSQNTQKLTFPTATTCSYQYLLFTSLLPVWKPEYIAERLLTCVSEDYDVFTTRIELNPYPKASHDQILESCATQKKFADFTCQVWKDGWNGHLPRVEFALGILPPDSRGRCRISSAQNVQIIYEFNSEFRLALGEAWMLLHDRIINFLILAARHLTPGPQCCAPIDRGAISFNFKLALSFETIWLSLEESQTPA